MNTSAIARQHASTCDDPAPAAAAPAPFMPAIVSGNPDAPAIMIAGTAAGLILQDAA